MLLKGLRFLDGGEQRIAEVVQDWSFRLPLQNQVWMTSATLLKEINLSAAFTTSPFKKNTIAEIESDQSYKNTTEIMN